MFKQKHPVENGIKNLILVDFARYFFMFLVVVILGLFFWVVSPFFSVLVYSSLIAVVFYPLYRRLLTALRGRKSLASFLMTLLIMVLFLAPLTWFFIYLAQEAIDAYRLIETGVRSFDFSQVNFEHLESIPLIGEPMQNLAQRYGFEGFLQNFELDLFTWVSNIGENLSSFVVNQTANLLFGFGTTVLNACMLTLTVFFFFRDGEDLIHWIKEMSPLPKRHENEIEYKLKESIHGIVIGNFGTSLLQGIVGGIGFAIIGMENIVFWIALLTFASLIPYFGAALIWAPYALFLVLNGGWEGWFLGFWGTFGISGIDNFARPLIIGGSSRMHPLATFLVVLGGILIFGARGIIFGPLILSLTVTVLHIYVLEYREVLRG